MVKAAGEENEIPGSFLRTVDYIFKTFKGIISPQNKYSSSIYTVQLALINWPFKCCNLLADFNSIEAYEEMHGFGAETQVQIEELTG